MNRRTFLKGSCKACMMMSAGLIMGSSFLESCASFGGMSVLKKTASNGMITLPLSDFSEQKTQIVRVKDYAYDIAVRELETGKYLALLMKCTHAGQPLTKTGAGFYCTLHGSHFSKIGKVETGPASQALAHLPVKVNKDQLIITLIDTMKV